jgi:DNA-binding transcriptional ArsR family regulator
MVTLSTLRDGDNLSFTRLQELLGLTPGNLITHLRKLEDAGYVTTARSGGGVTARTSVSLTPQGRQAFGTYTTVLRQLLDSASPNGASPNGVSSDGASPDQPGTASPDADGSRASQDPAHTTVPNER